MNKVYIELVFLDNLMLNFLSLLLCGLFIKSGSKIWRLLLAAAAGGCYACIVFCQIDLLVSLLCKIAAGVLMCTIAFAGRHGFLKKTLSFFITSFILAGCMYALRHSFIDVCGVLDAAARAVVFGACIASGMIIVISRVRKKALKNHELILDIRLSFCGKSVNIKAYYDTGNMLTEPLSGCGVILLERETAKQLFDEDILKLMEGKGHIYTDRLRILPCSTVAGQCLLYGIKLDGIAAQGGSANAVAALAQGQITGEARAIVGGKIMDELKGGTHNDKKTKNTHSTHTAAAENGIQLRLHTRKRSSASAAVKAGRSSTA